MPRWDDPGSAWGLGSEPAGASASLGTPAEDRYRPSGRVGAGAMGVVDAVWDARLQREVARKLPADGLDPERGHALLAHEARVTARLDHPNVVPVHDAGVLDDGRPYFTMRLSRGTTFDVLLADAQGPVGLPRLVRGLLDACRAVAHAHQRGVVHADLKPANLLVGAGGEVQVADWGLARLLDEPDVWQGAAGTVPWMAPEVEAGASPGPAADVYALGVMLREILEACGGSDELHAVARKATAEDLTERYARADELGAELERWLDGRPVLAHAYSARELLVRAAWAWRVPLALGALALTLTAGLTAASAARVAAERDRAVAAEAQIRTTAGALWADRAARALEAGDGPGASRAATEALALVDDPQARGVLAAGPAEQGIELRARGPLPVCERLVRVASDGVLCGTGSALRSLDRSGVERSSWSVVPVDALAHPDGAVTVLGEGRVTWFGADGAQRVLWTEAGGGLLVPDEGPGLYIDRLHVLPLRPPVEPLGPCPVRDTVDTAVEDGAGGWWAVCSGGDVVHAARDAAPTTVARLGQPLSRVVALARDGERGRLVAGTLDGGVVFVDVLREPHLRRLPTPLGAVRAIRVSPSGRHAAVLGVHGDVVLIRLADGVPLGRVDAAGVRDVGWWQGPGGEELVLAGEELTHWRVAWPGAPVTWQEHGGIGTAALDAAGGRLAVGVGPEVVVRALPSGLELARATPHVRIVKGLAFDGPWLVSGSMDDALALAWTDVAGEAGEARAELSSVRRVVRTRDGHLLGARFGVGLSVVPPGAREATILPTSWPLVDLVAPEDGDGAWALDQAGVVWAVDAAQGTLRELPIDVGDADVQRLAVSRDGGVLAVGLDRAVRVGPPVPGAPARVVPIDGVITAIGLDAAGGRLAVGRLDGRLEVWDVEGVRLAWAARGHVERVSVVLARPGQGWVTADWEGRVRIWQDPGPPR